MGGRRSQRSGPSPTLGSLGPSHHRRHKSRVSLRGPPCALGVSGIPFGEVRDILKAGIGGDGPSKEEFKLMGAQRRAQRTGDPTVLQKVLLDMPGREEFCTRDPHLEGAEVFGSQKRRPDTPIGDDGETHRPDTVNFSCPPPGKRVTRSQPVTPPLSRCKKPKSMQET
jgi:hypothetical protein